MKLSTWVRGTTNVELLCETTLTNQSYDNIVGNRKNAFQKWWDFFFLSGGNESAEHETKLMFKKKKRLTVLTRQNYRYW